MSTNYTMESNFKHIFETFKDVPEPCKQTMYELAAVILQQDERLNAIGVALGADCIEAQSNVVMEFMARAALKHDDIAIIELYGDGTITPAGYDGLPVTLTGISYNQCVDILNLLEVQGRGGDVHTSWDIFEPTLAGTEDEIYWTITTRDRLLIDKNTGQMVMVKHYTNAASHDTISGASYLFSLDVADKIKVIMSK